MIGRLHPDEVEALLHRRCAGRLACVAADGRPFVVPVAYAYAGGAIYGRTLPGRKLAVLRADPRVCVEVDERDGPGDWCSVVAEGTFEEVDDPAERRVALALLAGAGPAALSAPEAAPGVVFRLHLEHKAGLFVRPEPEPQERTWR